MAIVSVVVPVFHIEKYIEKCIESLISQTWQELEIILVDDGGDDRCGIICDSYAQKDSRIQVIHKTNGGLSDARNAGVAVATGKYLLFVDGDDSIEPDLVEICVKKMEEKKADVIIFDFVSIEEETGRRDVWSMKITRDKVLDLKTKPKLLYTTPGAWNKFYNRDFFLSCNLQFPKGRNFEDLATTPIIMEKARRIVYLDSKPLYHYMLRPGSIMRSNQFVASYDNRTKAYREVEEYFRSIKKKEKFQKELEYLCFLHCYFIPSKEIIYSDGSKEYMEKFRQFTLSHFPYAMKNPYVKEELQIKDRIMLKLLKGKRYGAMKLLSRLRFLLDRIKGEK